MKRYIVVTPAYLYHEIIVDGQGPYYDEHDVLEVEANTKKDAVALAVKFMLKNRHKFEYVRTQQADNACPYTGVRAYESEKG